MADVTTKTIGEITDPKVRQVLTPILRQAELAAEKVAAHHQQPKSFTLPAATGSLETILAKRFAELPEAAKAKAATNAVKRLAEPAAVRAKRFGEIGAVDLASSVPIEEQAAKAGAAVAPAVKLTINDLAKALAVPKGVVKGTFPALRQVELRLRRVRCIDETNGFFGSEAGADEISLGGSEVDETGDTRKISPFHVRNYGHDNESKTYEPPRRFTFFNLTEGTKFPKSYFVTMVLAEVDMGGLPEFVDNLYKWVKDKVVTALTAAIGAALGTASGGPIGAIIGVAVGWAVGKAYEIFKSVWEDEIFTPVTARLDVPSASHRFTGGSTTSAVGTATFSGHGGKYDISYDWHLFNK